MSGSKFAIPSIIQILSEFPCSKILIGSPDKVSYSAITCLQAPQGVTGTERLKTSVLATTAMLFIGTPGYCDEALKTATLSAHIPDGYAAFS